MDHIEAPAMSQTLADFHRFCMPASAVKKGHNFVEHERGCDQMRFLPYPFTPKSQGSLMVLVIRHLKSDYKPRIEECSIHS